jgi:hypothetical protein
LIWIAAAQAVIPGKLLLFLVRFELMGLVIEAAAIVETGPDPRFTFNNFGLFYHLPLTLLF